LRKRKEDIPILTRHFINQFNQKTGKSIKSVSADALRLFMDYSWPGNVRELENAIEHAFVLCGNDHISIFDLPVEIRQMEYRPTVCEDTERVLPRSRKKLTRSDLMELLYTCDWNKAEVARRIGKSRTSVWKYMKKWDIPLETPGR
jgi:DNA-binding NtrC family response regulator